MHSASDGGRALRDFEKRFPAHEKEGLALIEAVEQNRSFVQNQECTVYTDSRTWTVLENLKADASLLQRWSVILQGYEFILKHKMALKT